MATLATRIPDSIAHLDLATVADVLVKHGANVRAAALELGVPIPDLRRLTLVNQALINAAFEAEEQRLDRAEAVVDEALQSDDSRRRDAAAFFVLRNSAKSKKRGWIPSSSAGVDVNINAAPPVFTWRPMPYQLLTEEARAKEAHRLAEVQRALAEGHKVVQLSWRNSADVGDADDGGDADGETIKRDGRRIRMPRYDNGRRDESDCVEGELTAPATMIEHAVAAPEPVAVESEPDPAPEPVEPVVVESAADRYRREQIDSSIRARLIDYPRAVCFRCRRPFVAGAEWVEASNGESRARFHSACHAEWRLEREAAAPQALGLEG